MFKKVINLLKIAQRRYQETVVMVTHYEFIAWVSDCIISIEEGQIIDDSPPGLLKQDQLNTDVNEMHYEILRERVRNY